MNNMFYKSPRIAAVKLLGLWGLFDGKKLDAEEPKVPIPQIPHTENKDPVICSTNDLKNAIYKSSDLMTSFMLKNGVPGALVCVSKDNHILWHSSFGFCDVENLTPCEPDSLMRIASISKPIFAATVVAPMVENGKLSLESSVHDYLTKSEFPDQKFKDQVVDITLKQLLSHTSGVRSYLDCDVPDFKPLPIGSANSTKIYQSPDQYVRKEYYQRQTFRDVIESLKIFKDDPLENKPGEYNYTTYGYSVISAVAQKVHQKDEKSKSEQIEEFWMKVIKNKWGMKNTHLDYDEIIHWRRAKYYLRTSMNGALINAPYVDNSVKWAGGGLISTTEDLVKFANHLLDSYNSKPSAILKKETIDTFWKEVKNKYALGFNTRIHNEGAPDEELVMYHSGEACGAASMLLIMPKKNLVVAVIVNLGFTNPVAVAFSIADEFRKIN